MINLTAKNVQMVRVAGMTLMLQIAGLVLVLAATLWRPARSAPR
jgi:hypothetical protein